MDRLEQIKNEVCQEWGHTDWNDFGESFKHRLGSAHAERDEVITEIARRYAKAVAEDALKRADESVDAGRELAVLDTEINIDL